jgi:nucleoside-diphosphate-sugar epimerase
MNDVARCIGQIVGGTLQVQHHPLPENDPVRRRPDTTRAKERLNWQPRISLADGLRRTVDYFRDLI